MKNVSSIFIKIHLIKLTWIYAWIISYWEKNRKIFFLSSSNWVCRFKNCWFFVLGEWFRSEMNNMKVMLLSTFAAYSQGVILVSSLCQASFCFTFLHLICVHTPLLSSTKVFHLLIFILFLIILPLSSSIISPVTSF